MKLLIVTVVKEFEKEVLRLFKEARIDNFSGSEIDGYKNTDSLATNSSWFPSDKGGVESYLFFSFTDEGKINTLFELIKEFNNTLEINNPIKAVVVPIEKSI